MKWNANERFPTDISKSLFVENNLILVGTEFGLKKLTNQSTTQANIFNLINNPDVYPVIQIGKPNTLLDPIHVLDSDGNCAEIKGDRLSSCSNITQLNERIIVDNTLWTWFEGDNKIKGTYKISNANDVEISSRKNGRWPHDNLNALLNCENNHYELWSEGNILREENKQPELLADDEFYTLYCQNDKVPLGNSVILQSGTYALGENSVLELDKNRSKVGPEIAEITVKWDNGEVFHHNNQFRMLYDKARFSYEMYWPDDMWREMPWIDGLPAIDKTEAVQFGSNDISRITPIGVIDQNETDTGLQLKSGPISIRATKDYETMQDCKVDRVEKLDGLMHTSLTITGSPLQWRCKDGKVMRDSPNQSAGLGNVKILDSDLFANRIVINRDDTWVWEKIDNSPGTMPFVNINFKGEKINLGAGRFDFDEFKSIAAPYKNLEIVGVNGWWQNPLNQLGINVSRRNKIIPDPSKIISVSQDTSPENIKEPILCLLDESKAIHLYTDETLKTVDSCGYWTGSDSFWTYRQIDENSTATGIALNGPRINRQIENGRFTDLVAVASPTQIITNRETNVLVPTKTGVTIFNSKRNISGYHSFSDMNSIIYSPDLGPMVLWGESVQPYHDNDIKPCNKFRDVKLNIQKIESVSNQNYVITGLNGNFEREILILNCEFSDTKITRSRFLDMKERTRYQAKVSHDDEVDGGLVIEIENNTLRMSSKQDKVREFKLSSRILSVIAKHQSRELVIITPNEIFLLDVDAILNLLAS